MSCQERAASSSCPCHRQSIDREGYSEVSYCTGDSLSSTYDIKTPPYLQYARLLDPSMQSMQATHRSTDSETCLPNAAGGNEPMPNYQTSIPQYICNHQDCIRTLGVRFMPRPSPPWMPSSCPLRRRQPHPSPVPIPPRRKLRH